MKDVNYYLKNLDALRDRLLEHRVAHEIVSIDIQAKMANIGRTTLYAIMNGTWDPRPFTIAKLVKMFNKEVE